MQIDYNIRSNYPSTEKLNTAFRYWQEQTSTREVIRGEIFLNNILDDYFANTSTTANVVQTAIMTSTKEKKKELDVIHKEANKHYEHRQFWKDVNKELERKQRQCIEKFKRLFDTIHHHTIYS